MILNRAVRPSTATAVGALLGATLFTAGANARVTHLAVGGESVKPAATVLADAQAALLAQPTVRVAGSGVSGKQTITLAMSFLGEQGAVGSVTLGGNRIQLIRVGTAIYVKGSAKYWGKKAGPTLGGHWVRFATTSAAGRDYFPLTSLKLEGPAILKPTGALSPTVTTATVGTTPAAVLTDTSDNSQLSVTDDDASPLPLLIENPKESATLTFTYGVSVTPKAPAKYLVLKPLTDAVATSA